MEPQKTNNLTSARDLIDAYAQRTGINGDDTKAFQRYLWTDAFAVKTFLGLSDIYGKKEYSNKARRLTELVHRKLGRFSLTDSQRGWISGLPEAEGRAHPTAGGLRIGKNLRERQVSEPLDERLEWERDGQYFHYNTRWIHSLLRMAEETADSEYLYQAAELLLAGRKFILRVNGETRMFWKMSIDLSRPQVPSSGIHDPLEGLILADKLKEAVPELAPQLKKLAAEFENLCQGRDLKTNDTLGIGGLLLNSVKAAEAALQNRSIPEALDPERLLQYCLSGLENLENSKELSFTSARRLSFRECGLSLALRVLKGRRAIFEQQNISLIPFEEYFPLAQEIEDFWLKTRNQDSVLWKKHLDINAVSLAASIVAGAAPRRF